MPNHGPAQQRPAQRRAPGVRADVGPVPPWFGANRGQRILHRLDPGPPEPVLAVRADNPQHGIDIDVGLEEDKDYLVKLEKARQQSYEAGSRFDRRKRERQERWRARIAPLETIGEERRQVREQGGSTPILPWRRPQPLERRLLHVTCQCEHKFDVETDWREQVTITCPSCKREETLRGLIGTLPAP